ncbi:MAG: ATP-dependent sacrificial sulfur transferase LarE [Spirochaetota bacterium]
MLKINIEDKLEKLKNNIVRYDKAAVAFSGGVDSAFLLAVCADILKKDKLVAITASSETYTALELVSAREFANRIGVRHSILQTDELSDPVFLSNPEDRCYVCKKSFYSKAIAFIKDMGISVLLDGTNADDSSDYRPGYAAARELGIISPLMQEGFTKDDIRTYSKKMNLPSWDKPANPCLASRIPYGNAITKEKLQAIAKAEEFIRSLGFNIVRVRHHDRLARIEIPASGLLRFMQDDNRKQVDQYLKSLGFIWIAVDIEGYRTGSLNSAIGGV